MHARSNVPDGAKFRGSTPVETHGLLDYGADLHRDEFKNMTVVLAKRVLCGRVQRDRSNKLLVEQQRSAEATLQSR